MNAPNFRQFHFKKNDVKMSIVYSYFICELYFPRTPLSGAFPSIASNLWFDLFVSITPPARTYHLGLLAYCRAEWGLRLPSHICKPICAALNAKTVLAFSKDPFTRVPTGV